MTKQLLLQYQHFHWPKLKIVELRHSLYQDWKARCSLEMYMEYLKSTLYQRKDRNQTRKQMPPRFPCSHLPEREDLLRCLFARREVYESALRSQFQHSHFEARRGMKRPKDP